MSDWMMLGLAVVTGINLGAATLALGSLGRSIRLHRQWSEEVAQAVRRRSVQCDHTEQLARLSQRIRTCEATAALPDLQQRRSR